MRRRTGAARQARREQHGKCVWRPWITQREGRREMENKSREREREQEEGRGELERLLCNRLVGWGEERTGKGWVENGGR